MSYDAVNSIGAREGALDAIKEFNEVTNGSVQVDSFLVDPSGDQYKICRQIVNQEPEILFDVSLRSPNLVKVAAEVEIFTVTASLLEQQHKDSLPKTGPSTSSSKSVYKPGGHDADVDDGRSSTKISTYKVQVENRSMIHFKSPTRLLLEAVRDVTNKYELNKNFLRILYDKDYGTLHLHPHSPSHYS